MHTLFITTIDLVILCAFLDHKPSYTTHVPLSFQLSFGLPSSVDARLLLVGLIQTSILTTPCSHFKYMLTFRSLDVHIACFSFHLFLWYTLVLEFTTASLILVIVSFIEFDIVTTSRGTPFGSTRFAWPPLCTVVLRLAPSSYASVLTFTSSPTPFVAWVLHQC